MSRTRNAETKVDITENTTDDDKKASTTKSLLEFCNSNWKAILTELVSTFMLLLFGCMSCIPIDGFTLQPPLYAPLGFGLVVIINVHTFGHISGAHMNPAVTLTAVLTKMISIYLGIAYIIAQFIGAMLGFGMLVALSPVDLVSRGVCTTVPHANQHFLQTLGFEIALTAMLGLVCCSAWDPVNKHNQDSTSLKFGFIIASLSIAGGPFTGASMNPARTLAPAVWTNTWTVHWVYWIGPLTGSCLAVLIYWMITTRKEETKELNSFTKVYTTNAECQPPNHLVYVGKAHHSMEDSILNRAIPEENDNIQLQRLLDRNN